MGKTKTTEQFKKEMKVKNPNIEVLGEYYGNKIKILVKGKICNHEWSTSIPRDLLRGTGCPICNNISKKRTTEEFKKEMSIISPHIEILGEYIDSRSKILVKDKRCNHKWETIPDILIRGSGCPKCRYNVKTTEQFKNEMKEVNPNIEILGEYIGVNDVIMVRDIRCGHKWNTSKPSGLLKGSGCPICVIENRRNDRTGEINYSKNKEKVTIIKYITNQNISVQFEDGTIINNRTYCDFLHKQIINPYHKSVHGIGYIGEGKYVSSINNKFTPQYSTWVSMINRCYNKKYQNEKAPTYKKCSVAEEWHNFQNFAEWYDDNYYEVPNEIMCLDKDILYKGNKVYSPETCVLVPNKINTLFCKCDAVRGKYPIGVNATESDKYVARYRNTFLGKATYIGMYLTPEEAFYKGYKPCKEKHIKEMAEYYKDKIPKQLYEALYRYEVEITD